MKLISSLIAIGTLVGGSFAAYSYIEQRPAQDLKNSSQGLEKKIEEERSFILAYVDSRDKAKTEQINNVNDNVNFTRQLLLDRLQKLDDRIYELQRRPAYNASGAEDSSGGG